MRNNYQKQEDRVNQTKGRMHSRIITFIKSLLLIVIIASSENVFAQNCTVNANVDQNICANATLTLVGARGGLFVGATTWSQVSGPTVIITTPGALTTTVTGISGGNSYRFRLSSTCTDGSLVFDDVNVTVRVLTIANAGPDQTVCPGAPAGTMSANTPGTGETGAWSGSGAGITVSPLNSPTANITAAAGSSGNATLTWTITNSNGCVSTDQVVITNRGGVTPVSAGPDILTSAIACYSTTASATMAASFDGTNIDGQTGVWTVISGPNTPVITTQGSNTTTVTGLIQGTYTLRWTVSGPCVNGFDEMQIFVPVATATLTSLGSASTQTFCDNRTSALLTAPAPLYVGETVTWSYVSGPAGSVITSPNSSTTSVTGLNGTAGSTYVFRYTITNSFGCTANVTRTITFVAPAASLTITGGNQVLACNATTASISFTSTGGNQTQWRLLSGPTGTTYPTSWTNTNSPANVTGLNNFGTYVVQLQRIVTGATNTCPPVTAQVNVTTSKTPTASNAGSGQLLACSVFSTQLAANQPATGAGTWYQVSGPNTATIVDNNLYNTNINGLINGLYTFRWVISGGPGCTTNQANVRVAVANIPPTIANAGPDQNVCFNTPVILAGNAPVLNETGTWTVTPSAGVTISNINSPNAIVTLPNASTAYTFTWTITNGCGTSFDNTVITTFSTQGPVASNAGTDQCLSAGTTSITLTGNNPTPGTGLWTKLTGGTASITTPTAFGTAVTGMANGIYTFEWAISSGTCAVSRDTVMVTISAPVTVSNAGSDQNLCVTSTNFAANTPIIGTGTWSEVSAPGGYTIANPNSPTSSITGLVAGVYTFRWTISNGSCTASTDDVQLFVSTPPATANAGGDQSICNVTGATTATMAGNTPTNGTGAWSVVSGPNIPVITTVTSPSTTVTGLIQGTYVLRWTIAAGPYCPSSTDDMTLTVVPLSSAGTDQTLCGVTFAQLTGTAGSTGTWSQVGATPNVATPVLTGPNTALVSGMVTGIYTFRYTIAAAGSCAATTDDMTVTIFDQGTAANAGSDQNLCRTGANITVTLAGNTPAVGTGTWSKLSGPTGG